MSRVKTFDSTGLATAGRLYAGDLNAMQDQYADLTNLAQSVSVGSLAIGESGLQLLRYGAGEARISGALRTDGIVRALGGFYGGAFTTAQRDAIPLGFRPYGLVILNSTLNSYEWNSGSDAAPNWAGIGGGLLTFRVLNASGTLAVTDSGKAVEGDASTPVVITVPTNASIPYPIGGSTTILQHGTGQVSVAPQDGTVIIRNNGGLKLAGQGAMAALVKRGTNEWYFGGNTIP
jgi:hypothetical protein